MGFQVWSDLAAEKTAAMLEEADALDEGVEEKKEKADEEDNDEEENDDDLFGDGDALYGGKGQDVDTEAKEEPSNEVVNHNLEVETENAKAEVEEQDEQEVIGLTGVALTKVE